MRISVFGMGYVGCVTAACLASEGHDVMGVDINPAKVKDLNSGVSPILEKGLNDIISRAVSKKKLVVSEDEKEAVKNSDISYLCVGTPSQFNGSIDLRYLERIARDIGTSLREKDENHSPHIIVNRSTSLPGTLAHLTRIIQESSGRVAGQDFQVAANPEFLREGSAVKDFYEPPYTLVGSSHERPVRVLKEIYSFLDAPFYDMSVQEAELIKYANNAFHGLKIAFANEIGRISKGFDVDSRKIMDLVAADKKLNLSSYYLKPGFAFGGSCLPKDLRALCQFTRHNDIDTPLIDSILISNEIHINNVFDLINRDSPSKIGFVGLSFKPGTDDLRESPAVNLAERLIGKGNEILIFDQNVFKDSLIGSNREFVLKRLPHFFDLLTNDLEELVKSCEILIVVQKINSLFDHPKRLSDKKIFDLVGYDELKSFCDQYVGICW